MGELQGVPDTLFVPLAVANPCLQRFPEYFHDQTALSREGSIPGDACPDGVGVRSNRLRRAVPQRG